MTSASNSLYRGELNGNALGALQAIVEELEYEAAIAEDEDGPQNFVTDFRNTAQQVRETKVIVQNAIDKALAEAAHEIHEREIGGDMNGVIVQSLLDGHWERCAI